MHSVMLLQEIKSLGIDARFDVDFSFHSDFHRRALLSSGNNPSTRNSVPAYSVTV